MNKYSLLLVLLIVWHSSEAWPSQCSDKFSQANSTLIRIESAGDRNLFLASQELEKTVEDLITKNQPVEAAWLLERAGFHHRAEQLLLDVERQLTTIPIKPDSLSITTKGSHGSRKAVLENGLPVLVKLGSGDQFVSIFKEVGLAEFARMLGISVPPAAYQYFPKYKTVVSVHYYMMTAKNPLFFRRAFMDSEMAFFYNLVGYSGAEIKPRNVMTVSIPIGGDWWNWHKLLFSVGIDMGSGLLSYSGSPSLRTFKEQLVRKSTYQKMKSITLEQMKRELKEYFSEDAIENLFLKTKLYVEVFSFYDFDSGKIDEAGFTAFKQNQWNRPMPHVYQWRWSDAMEPPAIAKEHGL